TTRQDFTSSMITTLKDGSANLVNCDTTEEGVNLTTLQTQQSLAINSLSIANQSAQSVLSLFS
ncbi:MAG: flagellin, partial [Deltaproteobacteria bacterium]|nr:flagellin [Deltaproteobacteria bacterium]